MAIKLWAYKRLLPFCLDANAVEATEFHVFFSLTSYSSKEPTKPSQKRVIRKAKHLSGEPFRGRPRVRVAGLLVIHSLFFLPEERLLDQLGHQTPVVAEKPWPRCGTCLLLAIIPPTPAMHCPRYQDQGFPIIGSKGLYPRFFRFRTRYPSAPIGDAQSGHGLGWWCQPIKPPQTQPSKGVYLLFLANQGLFMCFPLLTGSSTRSPDLARVK